MNGNVLVNLQRGSCIERAGWLSRKVLCLANFFVLVCLVKNWNSCASTSTLTHSYTHQPKPPRPPKPPIPYPRGWSCRAKAGQHHVYVPLAPAARLATHQAWVFGGALLVARGG